MIYQNHAPWIHLWFWRATNPMRNRLFTCKSIHATHTQCTWKSHQFLYACNQLFWPQHRLIRCCFFWLKLIIVGIVFWCGPLWAFDIWECIKAFECWLFSEQTMLTRFMADVSLYQSILLLSLQLNLKTICFAILFSFSLSLLILRWLCIFFKLRKHIQIYCAATFYGWPYWYLWFLLPHFLHSKWYFISASSFVFILFQP